MTIGQGPATRADELVVGGCYVHRDHGWYRRIVGFEDDQVDWVRSRHPDVRQRCSRLYFVETCPTVATPEEIAYFDDIARPRMEDIRDRLTRLTIVIEGIVGETANRIEFTNRADWAASIARMEDAIQGVLRSTVDEIRRLEPPA